MSASLFRDTALSATCAHVSPVVGCDLQEVAPVAEAMARYGNRYLRAVLAPGELSRPARWPAPSAQSVAGRFAAKEAVLKTLRPEPTDAVPWPHIVILTDSSGAPHVHLTGAAARLAERRGVHAWSVSVSHDGGYAMACVTALEPVAPAHPPSEPGKQCIPDAAHTIHQRQKRGVPPMDTTQIESTVRTVLAEHGKLAEDAQQVAVDADLYRAGMTSHASVNVMLGLEDEFDIEFPEERLTKATFTSVASITQAVEAISNE